ncbi:CBASS cGAMP-activated phospholipase [Oxalobacteraceae bacterium R-40]|uniref:CBASS cGAMP-activated phospholipase n=1 Tax=Keguizhuia sedimenti TaxID=3064264 RepID=A0ABU1BVM5_9BURK|nr:CBASS cGAMP-activated phospholipase [Oxalobacteraceae bacterium R-40]
MNTSPKKTFQILTLSGGGYRGLHIAQVLEIIEERIEGRIARHFDLIAGTSIGGIIALALSLEIPARDIRQTLEDLGPSLFPRKPPDFATVRKVLGQSSLFSRLWHAYRNKAALEAEEKDTRAAWYDPKPLREALSAPNYFGTRLIKDLSHPVIIPAVNYSTGLPKFFKTDHHHSFTFDRDLPIIDVALGTAAAPIYFPVHKVQDWRIVDGGLIANDPTQVAVHEAMMFFGIRPPLFGDSSTGSDDLRVLSIGTLSPKHFADIGKPLNQGMLDWGTSVFDLAGSAQEAMSAFMVDRHMLPNKVIRLPSLEGRPEKAPGLADVSAASTEYLRGSARHLAQSAFGRPDFNELFKHTGRTLPQVRTNIAMDDK